MTGVQTCALPISACARSTCFHVLPVRAARAACARGTCCVCARHVRPASQALAHSRTLSLKIPCHGVPPTCHDGAQRVPCLAGAQPAILRTNPPLYMQNEHFSGWQEETLTARGVIIQLFPKNEVFFTQNEWK